MQNLLSHAPNGAERKLSFGTIKRAAALLDWRDNDDLTRINGAEKKQYQDAGLNYQPRNKNFQTLEELQMVLGMDEATLNWLEPLITVYSPSSAVNLHLATKEVLQLLLRLDVKIIEQYVTARANSVKNNLLPPLLPIGSSIAESSETSILDVVTIICEAQLNDASTAVVSVLVKKSEGLQNMPFEQLKWQRFTANNASLFATNMNELVVKHYAESELNN